MRGPATQASEMDLAGTRLTPPGRSTLGRHGRWLLVASLTLLLSGGLAATAWATPHSSVHLTTATTAPAAPAPASDAPRSAVAAPLPTVDTCTPGSGIPVCTLLTTPTGPAPATTTTPCAGEDCIPQPTTAPPAGGQPGTGNDGSGSTAGSSCGITNISGCISNAISNVFAGLVNAALTPVLTLLGQTVLSTPTLDQLPGVGQLWNSSWQIVLACYGLLIVVGGILVMAHESVQTRYSIKEIGPRIVLGFLASALSLFFVDKIIRLDNALTLAILGQGVAPTALGGTLQQAIAGAQVGGLFVVLVGLALVVLSLGLLLVYIVRVIITLILIISAPLFLMCHALPHTDPIARWWWKTSGLVAAIQIGQSLVLVVDIRIVLTGGVRLFSSPLSSLGLLIASLAVLYVLFKIPFWVLSAAKVSSGRSLLGGLLRAYVAAKTLGVVGARTGAFGRPGVAAAGSRRQRSATGTGVGRSGPADPPWPPQPRVAPSADVVSRRLREQYDAERLRAARRSRIPSQAPQFLQPTPQIPTRDHPVGPATEAPAMPEFSAAPTTGAPRHRRRAPRRNPPFQTPGRPLRTSRSASRPIRTATVPPALRFQPPTAPSTGAVSTPSTSERPTRAQGPAPAVTFQPATPTTRVGPTAARTPSPAGVEFRTPTPARPAPPPPPRRSSAPRPGGDSS